jgi:hypothetical protein
MATLTISLECGEEYTLEENVYLAIPMLRDLVEDCGKDNVIEVPQVSSETFHSVLEWIKYHLDHPKVEKSELSDEEKVSNKGIEEWESRFLDFPGMDVTGKTDDDIQKQRNQKIYDLFCASQFLGITDILSAIKLKLISFLKGKTIEELVTIFNSTDFTKEVLAVLNEKAEGIKVDYNNSVEEEKKRIIEENEYWRKVCAEERAKMEALVEKAKAEAAARKAKAAEETAIEAGN